MAPKTAYTFGYYPYVQTENFESIVLHLHLHFTFEKLLDMNTIPLICDFFFLLNFYSAGETPDKFKLCRRDESTKQRHFSRRHGGKKSLIMPFDDKDETVLKARDYAMKWDNGLKDEKIGEKKIQQKRQPTIPKESISKTVVPSIFNAPTPTIKSTSHKSLFESNQSSLPHDDGGTATDKLLHQKIDTLTTEFRDLKLHLKSVPTLLHWQQLMEIMLRKFLICCLNGLK